MNAQSAQVILSGGYERRRGYLTAVMYTLNQLTVTTVVAIWAFLIRWDVILKPPLDWGLFAIEAAWAGALSSLVIGVWRIYERQLDAAIIRLYPAIYLCERLLLPSEVCTVNPPAGFEQLSKEAIEVGMEFRPVRNVAFGGRGHTFEDFVGVVLVLMFAIVSVSAGYSSGTITFMSLGQPHQIGLMLIGNATGAGLIVSAYIRWRNGEISWPVQKSDATPQEIPISGTAAEATAAAIAHSSSASNTDSNRASRTTGRRR